MINIIKTIDPMIKSPPPTNSPNVLITFPGSPVLKISLVAETFNEIRNNVVNSNMVGNADILNTSFENKELNKIVNEMAILNASMTSSKNEGIGTIKNTIAANKNIPTPISVFFIV